MKENSSLENSEIYKKQDEIFNLCLRIHIICKDLNDQYAEILLEQAAFMLADSSLISAKLTSAWHLDIYDLKMENACLIRKAARDILLTSNSLISLGFKDEDYLQILRRSIEDFRILFAEWVKTFDPWNYHIDRWGLFNPPGVNYDDHDPDEDLPNDPDRDFPF